MQINKIYNLDCLEGMKQLEDNSVDLIVTDPPYGYSFMGKEWDSQVPSVEIWQQALRVLKAGAFAFVMSAPRQDVQVQMINNLHKAGFNMNFTPLYWAYASGFPKAGNISKMVDKKLGVEREVIGQIQRGDVEEAKAKGTTFTQADANKNNKDIFGYGTENITIPKSNEAKSLDGSYAGFQPKPAVEIILVAMKPITEKTYVEQALKNKKGITWLDDCRVPYESEGDIKSATYGGYEGKHIDHTEGNFGFKGSKNIKANNQGRFPANLLVSDDVLNDGNITEAKGGDIHASARNDIFDTNIKPRIISRPNDSGSFSRYFDLDKWYINKLPLDVRKTFPFMITPKASSSEKNDGLDDIQPQYMDQSREIGSAGGTNPRNRGAETARKNFHPTTKPIKLKQYLITLGSRQNDLILDPFIGSGTTGIAARQLTRNFIGFELNKEYHQIALARVKDELAQKKLYETCIFSKQDVTR